MDRRTFLKVAYWASVVGVISMGVVYALSPRLVNDIRIVESLSTRLINKFRDFREQTTGKGWI